VCSALLIFFYVVVLAPDFFATEDPEFTDARQSFIPTQPLHLFDGGGLSPWVPGVVGKRNPTTLRMEWQVDESKKIPVRFFTKGYPYKLLGIIETNIHLIGPASGNVSDRLSLLGTDRLGRDQWSRLMFGTRTSMTIGMIAVILSTILGVALGGISGYFGGIPDLIIQRLIELLQSLPTIPIWLALTAALPQDWRPEQVFFAITIILSLIGWTTLAREVRGRFLALREEDFVLAAELAGCSRWRIIMRHMVPTFMSHIIATATLAIPVMIVSETSLSFLGLGLRPPAISWGVLLQEAQNIQTIALAPWLLSAGIVVVIVVLAFNLVGDGLRDAADPYSH
jgi:peptide/nickel transport system permease protein